MATTSRYKKLQKDMPNCEKCGRNEILVTLYALGFPKKVCRNCERLYQTLPASLRGIYVSANLPVTASYGNTYCRVCGESSTRIYTIPTKAASKKYPYLKAYLCKRCSKLILKVE